MCYRLTTFLDPSNPDCPYTTLSLSLILSPATQSSHQDESSAITTIKDKLNKPPNAKEFETSEFI